VSTILCLQQRRQAETDLLDIGDLGGEALRDLRDNLLDERLVFHRLSRFHDPGGDIPDSIETVGNGRLEKRAPDNGRLDYIFAIFVDRLQDITRLGLDLSLNWLVQVHANLL
jgi:hypothetical protein